MNLAARLSLVCGFSSLSVEILWVRLYGFAKSSTPAAFGLVLCMYLLGIALGAGVGARACRRIANDLQLWRLSVAALLLSAVLTPVLPALFARAAANGVVNPLLDLAAIAAASAVLSFVFPIAHHLGTRDVQVGRGRHFARVYTANVMGAALGPLVTGYVLLQFLSLQLAFLAMAVFQAAAALLLARALGLGRAVRACNAASLVALVTVSAAVAAGDSHGLVRQFMQEGKLPRTVIENRHGIVTVFAGKGGDDSVYGGNVYDGRTNLDPFRNSNGLQRPLLLGVLRPAPRKVLMVGLSIGTWLAVTREFPGIESIDVIEINPGYLAAAQDYPLQAAALRDPRVRVIIDDARGWLRRHPEQRYDLVIMNTTYHWRANASMLLSEQMLRLVRSRMAPAAVMGFNATGSPDAFHTAAHVFPHAYRYQNFVYAAEFDFRPRKDSPEARALYESLRMNGKPFFPPGSTAAGAFLAEPFVTIAADQSRASRRFELLTDENMVTEFRYGRRLFEWADMFDWSATIP